MMRAMTFKSFASLNSYINRSFGQFSQKSIAELNKYLYIDESRIQSKQLENELPYRYPATEKINLPRLKECWKIFRKHSTYKEDLEHAQFKLYKDIKTLKGIMKNPNDDIIKRIDLCNNRIKFINLQLQAVSKYHNQLRDVVLNEYLSLPNDLHEKTPKDATENVIYSRETSSSSTSDHLIVGKKLNVLNYVNSSFYFLLNDAALLEFATINFFMKNFQNEKFLPFLNPDTCNNFIVDGTSDGKSDKFFKLEGDSYSLVGGSSFSSFCALRVGQSVHIKYLPERNISYGRHYIPQTRYKTEDGLYSVFQRSNVHLLITTETKEQMNDEFHKTLQLLESLYNTLNVDCKIAYQPACTLLPGESLRASIQLYSTHMKKYVEVAHLSMYGDFVSKRLLMVCHNKDSKYKFSNLIEGVAVSYPTLLAHLLERSDDKGIFIPECLRSFMYHKL